MPQHSILYLAQGGPGTTSDMKAGALRRLGHAVQQVNLAEFSPRNRILRSLHHRTGYRLLAPRIARTLRRTQANFRADVVWVDSGMLADISLLRWFRERGARIVNYNHDDPTGARDGNAWATFLRAVPAYDLLVTVRRETEQELLGLGARRVMRVLRSYDEVVHRAVPIDPVEAERLRSRVLFLGTWMPERGPFLNQLVEAGIPLSIVGNQWDRCEFAPVRACVRHPGVDGQLYSKWIQCSEIALGLLSKGNRDLHTTRSAEVPAIGAAFCAERTDEHLEMYREGTEAVFWSDAAECAEVCLDLLAHPQRREALARAGQRRAHGSGYGHQQILGSVLSNLFSAEADRS